MLTGLEILLDRMKTNPEEFLKEDGRVPYDGETFGGKWSDLLDYAWRIADKDERDALDVARKEFYRDDLNERVMKRLAGEEVKQVEQPSPFIVKQAAQQQMLQNSVLVSSGGTGASGQYNPNTYGTLTASGGFQAAETKQEGAPVGGFLGLGKLFWGKK
jgi:hypothetical protein